MSYDFEEESMIQKINKNSENHKKIIDEAFKKSENEKKEKLKKKKQKIKKIKKAIAAVTLAIVVASGTYTLTSTIIQNNNVIISLEEADKEVDKKISNYESIMKMDSGEGAIEIYAGRTNFTRYSEPNVYYNAGVLSDHLVKAAETSEEEFRCALIAAYRIINAPYRDETINHALSIASSEQEESKYSIPSSSTEFLESLGYEDWKEYNNNERRNIKELNAINERIGGKHK